MRVISTSGTRTAKFILRETQTATTSYKVVLTNEDSGAESEIDVANYTITQLNDNNGQIEVTFTSTYTEGLGFSLKITSKDGNTLYHRNKIFVTDQTPQNYSING